MAHKSYAFRKFIRRSKREAFECGFFSIFGLANYPVEPPIVSVAEALQEDCSVISNDLRRVFDRESELVDEQSK